MPSNGLLHLVAFFFSKTTKVSCVGIVFIERPLISVAVLLNRISTRCLTIFLRYLHDIVRHSKYRATSWRCRGVGISWADREGSPYRRYLPLYKTKILRYIHHVVSFIQLTILKKLEDGFFYKS
ncbi:hypothetical protein AVEN_1338-1 [Araneus ventricosus]|uniref:Uncharacterized protein n=1 Tax=Araneus ventricosus TaxID=182803 RepID=A0A4Y2D2T3_ARAVE|nr:hypothetical protein AVEN_1338-1 [Araneus ventricosus]